MNSSIARNIEGKLIAKYLKYESLELPRRFFASSDSSL